MRQYKEPYKKTRTPTPQPVEPEIVIPKKIEPPKKPEQKGLLGMLSNLKTDDFLLLGIILLLLTDDNTDELLVIVLGYLFISGL